MLKNKQRVFVGLWMENDFKATADCAESTFIRRRNLCRPNSESNRLTNALKLRYSIRTTLGRITEKAEAE